MRPWFWLSQVNAITGFALRSLPERKGSSAAAALGIAGVVAVLVGVLSIAQGFRHAMTASGSPDTVIVLRTGSDGEMMSGLQRDDVRVIADAPGIARTARGVAASSELFVVINLPKRSTGSDANVPLRGVDKAAFDVRTRIQIIEGRTFEPGRNEMIVGQAAAKVFAGIDLNRELRIGNNTWKVVGIFSDGGGISDSEIWTDAKVLQAAYRRGETYQSVYARLNSPDDFQDFKDALTSDPRLKVDVIRQTDYYQKQSTALYTLVTGVGTFISVMMGAGALFGALNTMYNTVSARTREIATLRALGFQGGPIIVSILVESLFLAVLGGSLGAILAYAAFNGLQTSTINFQSFSQVAFAFAVTPALLVQGIVYALLIGLVGGFFPALRASRIPVAAALREL